MPLFLMVAQPDVADVEVVISAVSSHITGFFSNFATQELFNC